MCPIPVVRVTLAIFLHFLYFSPRAAAQVQTFGLAHLPGVQCKPHEYPDDADVIRGHSERYSTAHPLTAVMDCRNILSDAHCPNGHTGHHVDFLWYMVSGDTTDIENALRYVKYEFRNHEALNRQDNKTYVLGCYCKAGTHRSVCFASILPDLCALNIEEATALRKAKKKTKKT